jgi:hypothetical protein
MSDREKRRFDYHVVLSFAGEDREAAEKLAELLTARGVRVFYDRYETADLWGKDLYQHFQTVYRDKAKFAVVFVSEHYVRKAWPRHELKQVQARDFMEGREYILPLRIDDSELPGLNPTVGYVDLRETTIEGVANLLLDKVFGPGFNNFYSDPPPDWDGDMVEYRGAELASFWPEKIRRAQEFPYYETTRRLPRVPYGSEKTDWGADSRPCPDCGVLKGELHVPSCDIEQCPQCDGQAYGCSCIVEWVKEDTRAREDVKPDTSA